MVCLVLCSIFTVVECGSRGGSGRGQGNKKGNKNASPQPFYRGDGGWMGLQHTRKRRKQRSKRGGFIHPHVPRANRRYRTGTTTRGAPYTAFVANGKLTKGGKVIVEGEKRALLRLYKRLMVWKNG